MGLSVNFDLRRDVTRPAFAGIEADDANRVPILPIEQVLDHGLEVGRLDIGFAVGAPAAAEIVHDQADVPILVTGTIEGVQSVSRITLLQTLDPGRLRQTIRRRQG